MNISVKRILKGVAYSSVCVIMISVIGLYSFGSIEHLLTKKEVKVEETKVLGVKEEVKKEEITEEVQKEIPGYIPEGLKDEDYDYQYFKKADLIVEGLWNPKEYVPVNTIVNNPEYEVKGGDNVKDSWDLDGKITLSLECEKISDILIKVPAYWGSCTVTAGQYVFQDNVRADVNCKVYGGMKGESSGCTQQPVMTYYRDTALEYDYLVLGTADHGSGNRVKVYQIDVKNDRVNEMFFDLKDLVLDSKLVNHPSGYFMSFTSDAKEDFCFVSIYHDPAMRAMLASFNEWKITNGRLLLDRNIVSVAENTLK